MQYLVTLTLISDHIEEELPADWVAAWDSITDLLDSHYHGSGGSAIKLNSDLLDEFRESPLSNSEIDFDEDPPIFPVSGDGFQIVADSTLEDGAHEVTYQIRTSFELCVEAESEDEAVKICNFYVPKLIDIWDVGADDVIGTQEIEFLSIALI